MKKERTETLYDSLTDVDPSFLEEAGKAPDIRTRKGTVLLKWAVPAACLCLVFSLFLTHSEPNGEIELSDRSKNVTAAYLSEVPDVETESCLVAMSEEELFTTLPTAILKGTVTDLKNIELSFQGEKVYRAVATLEVEKVYRGTCREGDSVTILLPCPIGNDMQVSTCSILESLKVGMTGIFMLVSYNDENALWEENGAVLDKRDLSEYGLPDGERYLFLETDDGLLFDRISYNRVKNASTLTELEDYITKMIQKTE